MLAVRFLPSAPKASLESDGDAMLLSLDVKLQVSVANLLEVLLKSCQGGSAEGEDENATAETAETDDLAVEENEAREPETHVSRRWLNKKHATDGPDEVAGHFDIGHHFLEPDDMNLPNGHELRQHDVLQELKDSDFTNSNLTSSFTPNGTPKWEPYEMPLAMSMDDFHDAEGDDMEEVWATREAHRKRQIRIGKSRPEYFRYITQVKRKERLPHHPRTPSPAERTSKRHFDRAIGEWRRALHHWAETDSDHRGAQQTRQAPVVPIRLSSYLDLDQ
eukprot:Skav223847  [mRNA]  locus=scaffold2304:336600:337824:+ [translate_table: standard]